MEFPLWDEYKKHIESDIADLKTWAAQMPAPFRQVNSWSALPSYPWVHFDIAGVAYLLGEDSYRGKMATGAGVRLIYNYLRSLAQ